MIYAKIGSVSEATLQPQDLLEAFSFRLCRLAKGNLADAKDQDDVDLFRRHLQLCEEVDEILQRDGELPEEAHEIVEELMNALDAYAPPYVAFGAHHGDGACFGFWLDADSLVDDALPKVRAVLKIEAGDEWPELGEHVEYVMEITDHGNATLFNRAGEEMWSCV